ncbi:hypothetical protein GCM10027184_12280 [Saccharothrix stipae]
MPIGTTLHKYLVFDLTPVGRGGQPQTATPNPAGGIPSAAVTTVDAGRLAVGGRAAVVAGGVRHYLRRKWKWPAENVPDWHASAVHVGRTMGGVRPYFEKGWS